MSTEYTVQGALSLTADPPEPYFIDRMTVSNGQCSTQTSTQTITGTVQHSYTIGGASTLTAGLSGMLSGLIASASASASSAVTFNGSYTQTLQRTISTAVQMSVPRCERGSADVYVDLRTSHATQAYSEVKVVCRRGVLPNIITATSECGSQQIAATVKGSSSTTITYHPTERIPGCQCSSPPSGGGGGPPSGGGGPPPGGGGGGGEDPCVHPTGRFTPGGGYAGIIRIGEDLLPRLGADPCFIGFQAIEIVPGSDLLVVLDRSGLGAGE